jgi:hypothetical protein
LSFQVAVWALLFERKNSEKKISEVKRAIIAVNN